MKSKRTYWIYDVPGGECRGSHAFRNTEEFIVALSGGFDVIVDDGERQNKFTLNRSYSTISAIHPLIIGIVEIVEKTNSIR